jgi:hypothetical protein
MFTAKRAFAAEPMDIEAQKTMGKKKMRTGVKKCLPTDFQARRSISWNMLNWALLGLPLRRNSLSRILGWSEKVVSAWAGLDSILAGSEPISAGT